MKILYLLCLLISFTEAFSPYFLRDLFWLTIRETAKTPLYKLQDLHMKDSLQLKKHNRTDYKLQSSLMIFKGVGKSINSYKPIAKKIQAIGIKKNLGLNIIIPEQHYIPFQTNMNLDIMERKYGRNFFTLGHSSGAYHLNNAIDKFKDKKACKGVIQYGCTLNSNDKMGFMWNKLNINNFTRPIMTIIGEKDGYFRYTNIVDEYINDDKKHTIVLNDINHLQITDNKNSDICNILGFKDLNSNINNERAQYIIAELIVDFMISVLNETDKSSINNINAYKDFTTKKLKYYEKALNLTSFYANYIQRIIANDYNININNKEYDELNCFLLSKPHIKNGTYNIYTYIDNNNRLEFSQHNKQRAPSIWLKMLYNETIPDFSIINKNNLQSILDYTLDRRSKYDYKNNLKFGKDKIHLTTLDWVSSSLKHEKTDNGDTILYNQVYIVNSTYLPKYCYIKIPSPVQLLEWVMIDTHY